MAIAKKTSAKKSFVKVAKKPMVSSAQTASSAVDQQLERYRSMRDFGVTAEPSGSETKGRVGKRSAKRSSAKENSTALPFCIQKHAASHLHYDFRLGWNGVLKSWAVAKGPSYNTADKRLAVQVEDHPMEYGGFEGIIPAGQYGGGTVMLWDQGTWEPQADHTDVGAGLKAGTLKFILRGTKMQGKWALIRMGGKAANERKPNWLLIKEHDDFEREEGPAVTEADPDSVITGRSLEQIADNEDHVWNSKDTATGNAWYSQSSESKGKPTPKAVHEAVSAAGAAKDLNSKMAGVSEESQPLFIKPQLALEAEKAPEGAGWLHELKLDGYRMQARKEGPHVQMLTRSGLDWTARVPAIAAAIALLPVDAITLDGEVVVVSAGGTTNFADLQASFQDGAKNPLTYFCFDLLHLNGHSVRDLPLIERKVLLATALESADADTLRISEHLETSGEQMFQHACALHAEGIVSKRSDSKYTSSRSGDWLKLKCLHEQEFVVGGYTLPSNGSDGVGALLLGYYRGGELIHAGRTGTGFTQKSHRAIRKKLDSIASSSAPFKSLTTEARRGARWVKPELVAQVRFATWTADNQMRQAAFLGLREDKPATEVVREDVAPTPKRARGVSASLRVPPAKTPWMNERAPIRLTHPEKILDQESAMTKEMLADYYWAIAESMLPYIKARPLSLVRCPEGSGKPCFFQKHVTAMLPKGIGSVMVPDKKSGAAEPYITLDVREALAGLAQIGVLEVHPWGATNTDLEHADRLVFDLDPDESLPWSRVCDAALDVRTRLKRLHLEGFLKTTGGKGLHVVVPIQPTKDWNYIKTFARKFVLDMEKTSPSLYLSKMTKAARSGKIYLDYLRNERGATSVAPYSPRARPNAPVSMPLAWSELKSRERPSFQVSNFADWSFRLRKDPWKNFFVSSQKLP